MRVQDSDVYRADDPTVLEWAARERRVVLTHDASTLPKYAYERAREAKPMPGVILVKRSAPIGEVIDDLLLVLGASEPADLEDQVLCLPL